MRVSEVVTRMLESKSQRGHRKVYVKELERALTRFAELTGNPPLSEVSPKQCETFIFRSESPGGQATRRSRLSALFSFAIRSRLRTENPLDYIPELRKAETQPPRILSPHEARTILQYLQKRPRCLAWFALGMFSGLRPCEALRTRWEDIRFQTGTLLIHGANSKTRRHRIIELHPTAIRWLSEAQAAGSELPIHPQPIRRELRRLRPRLELSKWPQDVLRHSCASYSLALSNDFTKTAWQLGNSEKILLRHYYRLTDRETAMAYWQTLPNQACQLELFPP